MAEFPIMPVATDSLIADTTHMTTEEFGAYMRLLVAMWRHGCRLPDDAGKLARIAGVSGKRWRKIAPTVMGPMLAANGEVTQGKLLEIWAQVLTTREKRSMAANVRWGAVKSLKNGRMTNAKAYPRNVRGCMPAISNQNQIDNNTTSYSVAEAGTGKKENKIHASSELAESLKRKGLVPS